MEQLLFYIRLETSEDLKGKLVDIMTEILSANINIHQLRAVIRTLHPVVLFDEVFVSEDNFYPLLSDPRIKELMSYKNFFQSTLSVFKLINNLINNYNKEPLKNDCLNFSGQGSGILIYDVEDFPCQSFSILIKCFFDNLNTYNKKSLYKNVRKNLSPQSVVYQSSENYSIVQPKPFGLDKNHFQKHSSGVEKELIQEDVEVAVDDDKDEGGESEDYCPRLLSLVGKNEALLEIYIENESKNHKRYLVVEVTEANS